jgi:hypothetical protein
MRSDASDQRVVRQRDINGRCVPKTVGKDPFSLPDHSLTIISFRPKTGWNNIINKGRKNQVRKRTLAASLSPIVKWARPVPAVFGGGGAAATTTARGKTALWKKAREAIRVEARANMMLSQFVS